MAQFGEEVVSRFAVFQEDGEEDQAHQESKSNGDQDSNEMDEDNADVAPEEEETAGTTPAPEAPDVSPSAVAEAPKRSPLKQSKTVTRREWVTFRA